MLVQKKVIFISVLLLAATLLNKHRFNNLVCKFFTKNRHICDTIYLTSYNTAFCT